MKETDVKEMSVGTLFIVTYTGGTIGREGDHSVLIPDISISKVNKSVCTLAVADNGNDYSVPTIWISYL